MNRITEWLRRQVESVQRTKEIRRTEEINARFSVRERDGKIYLLCNGTAVAIMTPASTMQDAIKQIKAMRAAALTYEKTKDYAIRDNLD